MFKKVYSFQSRTPSTSILICNNEAVLLPFTEKLEFAPF